MFPVFARPATSLHSPPSPDSDAPGATESGRTNGGSPERVAWRTVLVYAVAAAAWIGVSDAMLRDVASDSALFGLGAMAKGWTFVGVTAAGLFVVLRRELRKTHAAAEARAKAGVALRLWADAFASCAHGIAIIDPRTNLTIACNPALAQLLGRSMGELMGQPMLERYDVSVRNQVEAALAGADRTGSARVEARVRLSSGRGRDVEVDITSVRDAAGRLLHRVMTMQDITERKRAELALRESQLSLEEAQLVGGFGSWSLELTDFEVLENNRVACTDPCCRIFGFEPGERAMTVRDFLARVHADDRQRVRECAIAALCDLRGYRIEHRIVRKDGSIRHVLSAGEMLHGLEDGRTLRFVGTVHDVTERVRAETALRESEERFRAVVENIREVFWMRDVKHGRFLYVSPNFEQVWGRPAEELLARPAVWLELVHPEDKARVEANLERVTTTGLFDDEYRIVGPDGAMRWIRAKAFPVTNEAGEVVRSVGVAEDVTERKTLEAQFLRAQRMEAIGTLAGGIAHDLNNILSPMLMAAGLLKEGSSDPRARDMLSMVETSARRGADIIRQLLTFSRGAGGERLPIGVQHLAKEMCAIIRETFPREIALEANIGRDLWPVVADVTQLHQVLVNLTVNARDAMPHGGRLMLSAQNVTLGESDRRLHETAKPGPYVLVTVRDTGTGIAPEIMDRIFDPFFTTKDVEKGTGLGLSTVLGIVRGHGGFVTVESTVGEGSAFHVYLPALPAAVAERRATAAPPVPVGGGELVLVVDDEESIRAATRRVLEGHNYRVITASDGKEAVSRFLQEREHVRLVLTDLMMPQMSGGSLVRALRLIEPTLRVIATSGLESAGAEMTELGVVILPKPCGPSQLLAAVRAALTEAK